MHKAVMDGHRLVGDTSIRVDLFEDQLGVSGGALRTLVSLALLLLPISRRCGFRCLLGCLCTVCRFRRALEAVEA
ncbi:hypothetical protein K443DRAFT_492159, partial [Laccaria amethystina LaAM-08-1]